MNQNIFFCNSAFKSILRFFVFSRFHSQDEPHVLLLSPPCFLALYQLSNENENTGKQTCLLCDNWCFTHWNIFMWLVLLCPQVSGLPGSVFNLAPSHMFGNRLNPNPSMAALIAQSEASPAGIATRLMRWHLCVCVFVRGGEWIGHTLIGLTDRSRVNTCDVSQAPPTLLQLHTVISSLSLAQHI